MLLGNIFWGVSVPRRVFWKKEGNERRGAVLVWGGKLVSFSAFILVSIFQVWWVWAPIGKAILKHMKSENRSSRVAVPEVWFGEDCTS